MAMAQLSGRNSLRDIVESVSAQTHRLYHLGSTKLSRSSLSRINDGKPYELYEALFGELLQRCHGVVPGHNFCFNHPLYSLGASTINLCSSVFPWADFRTTKGAIKRHVGLNHAGYLPEFVTVTEGKTHDVTVGRTLDFPKGSVIADQRCPTLWNMAIAKALSHHCAVFAFCQCIIADGYPGSYILFKTSESALTALYSPPLSVLRDEPYELLAGVVADLHQVANHDPFVRAKRRQVVESGQLPLNPAVTGIFVACHRKGGGLGA